MLDVFNTSSPQQSNYQEFYGGGTERDWIKPRGASMVRFMLIGPGGGGSNGGASAGGGGGGSGAITSWIGPAIFIPDVLRVVVGAGGVNSAYGGTTSIIYQARDGTGYTLLTANSGVPGNVSTGGAGGAASTNNFFGAAGIFTSTAGNNGANGSSTTAGGNVSASTDTFLSGGAGGAGGNGAAGGSVSVNYGYPSLAANTSSTLPGKDGYFISSPILVGAGGAGGVTTTAAGTAGGKGGIGCGGGGAGEDALQGGGYGGDGAVFIWAW